MWTVWSLAAAVALSAACSSARLDGSHSLYGRWKFHPGDDARWAEPQFDDRDWVELQVPQSWGRQGYDDVFGMAWYRTRVPLDPYAGQPVGLALGKIDSAYEVYVGGRRLGGVGRLPPEPVMEYDRHRIFVVPDAAKEADGSVVIALRVWRADGKSAGAAGPTEGPFEIGPIDRVVQRELLSEAAQLGLVLLFAAVGIFHLALRLLRPGMTAYGWFGLLAFESATYAFLRTQWKYLLFDDFVALKKVEHLMIYLVPTTFLQFLWVFFDRPVPKVIRGLQAAMFAAGIVMIATPGLDVALVFLPLVQVTALASPAVGLAFVLPFIRAGDPEARLLGLGALMLVLTIASDLVVERNFMVAPRTVVYGFGVLVFGMSLAIANRFHRVLQDLDGLRRDLEQRVDTRTRELSKAYSQMEALALRDGLTGLLNRRALRDRAHAALMQARRQDAPFAIAMIDVDHFKAVNDSHGHVLGDQVLAHVASVLSGALRASDDVGRWGGEEFLALLVDADAEDATAAGERLRLHVLHSAFVLDSGPLAVSVSVGVVAVPPGHPDTPIDELIQQADDALYRAKARGRNRVECETAPLRAAAKRTGRTDWSARTKHAQPSPED